ncbi:ATP-binding cassette domain-containing protein [Hahella sp. KA22]|uniref:ABC transporter ATP-binding protein n=1 Tax=Hahella sp. KA22 TaxID=1628392 RepID=UPI000FDD3A48|nr:ABC transporter ATP-binding protein [Hahella sp. KA22]AZZ91692.1 ABC transporter ATP-binding protein [Hahella sp. KA22]QAY55062.1 ATP-binding cassette domain-containing protein [Hahella sp. KA22]
MIVLDKLTVEFPVFSSAARSFKSAVVGAATGGLIRKQNGKCTVKALDSLSLMIKNGERVGLIGHNGSGKTTLLKALASIYPPSQGTLKVNGRVASLIDLSLGMEPEASGYENIFLRGIYMGLSPKLMKQKVKEIAEFSELGDFLHLPLKTYSSGMNVRLAFAIATSVNADIILMDEWLSVGDEEFNIRAQEKLKCLVEQSSILVIASHSMELVHRVCSRVIHLEHGSIVSDNYV